MRNFVSRYFLGTNCTPFFVHVTFLCVASHADVPTLLPSTNYLARQKPPGSFRAGRSPSRQLPEETDKYLDQSLKLERLLQQGPIAVALPDVVTAVAGYEDERNAAGSECAGYTMSFVAVQIHIEQSGVENLPIDYGKASASAACVIRKLKLWPRTAFRS